MRPKGRWAIHNGVDTTTAGGRLSSGRARAGGEADRAVSESAPAANWARDVGGRVVLLISNLEYGGAQRQVVELANHANSDGDHVHVCCLSDYVPLAQVLHGASDCLHVVPKRHKFDVGVVPRLARLLRDLEASVVHSFLLDANVAARLAGVLNRRVAVIGSERNTDYTLKRRQEWALRLTRGCFDAIIANSNSGKRFQVRHFGVPEDKVYVVHNGVDIERFSRSKLGADARERLGIDGDAKVVGMICSFKRQKNHAMFFRMAKRVLDRNPDVVFLCVGAALHGGLQGSDAYHKQMGELVDSLGLSDAMRFVANQDDLRALYNLCDVTVLTSEREGTPNVLLESMACGTPVVATDVADNALIVPEGRVGYIVGLNADDAMADRVLVLLGDEAKRTAMGLAAREWVASEFSVAAMAAKTAAVYREVLSRKSRRRSH